jgi:hypothetical protein
MLKLMKLEVRRNSLKTYATAALIITLVMIGFLYLFAAIPSIDETEQDIEMFRSYGSIATLTCMLSMVSFSILSSVMYAKFVVEEYNSKKAILLFSYPVSRKKIFGAKIATVFLFTVISMVLSGFLTFGIFYITEAIFPICKDALILQTIIKTIGLIGIYSIMAGALALLSLWFGMWKKSTPATIVSGTVIVCVICNFLAVGLNIPVIAVGFTIVAILVGGYTSLGISKKIGIMEV